MELQAPRSVCAEAWAANSLRKDKKRGRENAARVMRTEGRGNNRGGAPPGSHTYARERAAEMLRIMRNGVLERKKRPDDVRQVRTYEIQIREPAIPAPRPFRGRGGKEQSCGGETYRKPVGGRRKARLRNSWKWRNRLSRLRPGLRAKQ